MEEILTKEEMIEITGYKGLSFQRVWLDEHGWEYATNSAGRPIVGRWFARLRLAGVKPTSSGLQQAGQPNFSALE